MKAHISATLFYLDMETNLDDQCKWEYLKYEMRKFSIDFSKRVAKKTKNEKDNLEKRLKILEEKLDLNHCFYHQYNECKTKLDEIYQSKVDGIRIRSKCDWYEHGENHQVFF